MIDPTTPRLAHCTPTWGGHSPACDRDGTYCGMVSTHPGPCKPHGAPTPTPEPICGCGHTVDRHCNHCGECNGTWAELDLDPWEPEPLAAGTVCLCTAYADPDR